jgi:hypothetical protein
VIKLPLHTVFDHRVLRHEVYKDKSVKKLMMPKFLAFVFIIALISGCAPRVASSPMLPSLTPGSISTATLLPLTISLQAGAIEKIRTDLELPELPLSFIGNTRMINSPGGDLLVAIYQDSAGRNYSVEPGTDEVVEIDARTLLTNISPDAQTLSMEVLRSRALKYITGVIPGFEKLQSTWKYEEGAKGDYYFFNWYGELAPGSMNRPFIQIGLHKSGLLFAYYNTLLLNK